MSEYDNTPDSVDPKISRRKAISSTVGFISGVAATALAHRQSSPVPAGTTDSGSDPTPGTLPEKTPPDFKNTNIVLKFVLTQGITGYYTNQDFETGSNLIENQINSLSQLDRQKISEIVRQRSPTIKSAIQKAEKSAKEVYGKDFIIDPGYFHIMVGIIKTESNNDPNAKHSDDNTIGLCGFRKIALEDIQKHYRLKQSSLGGADAFSKLKDPENNILAAMLYLIKIKQDVLPDIGLALMGYNEGPAVIVNDIYQYTIDHRKDKAQVDADFDDNKQKASVIYSSNQDLNPFKLYNSDSNRLVYFYRVVSTAVEATKLSA